MAGFAVLAALAALPAYVGRAAAEPVTEELEFFARTNVLRISQGLVPLVIDLQMIDVARKWSAEMARNATLSHNPDLQAQIADWRRLGENVGDGPTVADIEGAFEASPGHYRNLTDPDFRNVGIGVVDANGVIWVTVDFKTPDRGLAIPRLPNSGSNGPPAAPPPTAAPPAPDRRPAVAPGEQPTTVNADAGDLTPYTPTPSMDVLAAEVARSATPKRPAAAASPVQGRDHLRVSGAIAFLFLGAVGLLLSRRRLARSNRA